MKSRVASGNLTWHHNEIATVDQPLVGLSLGSCLVGGWGEVGWVTVRNAGAPRTYYLSSKFLPPKGKAEVLSASGEMILISKFQRLGHIFPYHLREKTTILVSIPEVSLSWFFFFFLSFSCIALYKTELTRHVLFGAGLQRWDLFMS